MNIFIDKPILISFLLVTTFNNLIQASDLQTCIVKQQTESLKGYASRGSYSTCSNSSNPKDSLYNKQSVSSDETALVSAHFEIVMDCFQLPWKKYFGKYAGESGFHSDIFGKGGDAGVGQLTGPAIQDIQQNKKIIWDYVKKSNRPSCQKLKTKIGSNAGKLFNFSSHIRNRCAVTAGEIGVIRNIFFSGALHHLNRTYVANAYTDLKIEPLLKEVGYKNAPHEKIKELLVVLSYNNGGRSSVVDFSKYLLARRDFIIRKKKELGQKSPFPQTRSQFLAEVTAADFDFSKGHERFISLRNQMKKLLRIEKLDPKDLKYADILETKDTSQGISDLKIGDISFPRGASDSEKLDIGMRNISVSLLGFPEWLRIWQSHGGPGYMSSVYLRSAAISNTRPECVDLTMFNLYGNDGNALDYSTPLGLVTNSTNKSFKQPVSGIR